MVNSAGAFGVVDTLKYGDVVFLYTEDETRGLAYTEGISDSRMTVCRLGQMGDAPVHFKNSLFRIVPMLQYLAQEELIAEAARGE